MQNICFIFSFSDSTEVLYTKKSIYLQVKHNLCLSFNVLFSDSPYINFISKEIIYLQEKQNISSLYRKWWKEKSNTRCEVVDGKKKNSMELGIENVGGVFIVLMGGSVFGVMLSFIEFLWKIKKNADADKVTIYDPS